MIRIGNTGAAQRQADALAAVKVDGRRAKWGPAGNGTREPVRYRIRASMTLGTLRAPARSRSPIASPRTCPASRPASSKTSAWRKGRASGTSDHTVQIWNLRTRILFGRIILPSPSAVAFAPDGGLAIGFHHDVAVFHRQHHQSLAQA
jgi:hypothetical protein